MMSEKEAGYRSKAPAASIVLHTNRKLGSDYCGSRKSKPTTSPTSSNFPLVLKSILKTNSSQQSEKEAKPVKTVSFIFLDFRLG